MKSLDEIKNLTFEERFEYIKQLQQENILLKQERLKDIENTNIIVIKEKMKNNRLSKELLKFKQENSYLKLKYNC